MASVNIHRVLITVKQLGAKKATKQLAGVGIALGLMGFAAIKAGHAFIEAGDEITRLKNKTAVFANTQKSANERLAATVSIARETNSSLKSVADVMQRVSLAGTGLGLSDQIIISITENLAKAVKLSGATAQEAEGAWRQFSQGLAANRLSGQELNSVLEQTPLIAKLLADSLNVATGALRQMGKDGLLTSAVLVKAFGSAIPELEAMFDKFEFPIEDLIVSIGRETTILMAKIGQVSGFTDAVRDTLRFFTDGLIKMNAALKTSPEAVEQLRVALNAVKGAITVVIALLVSMGVALAAATGGFSLLIPAAFAAAAAIGAVLGSKEKSASEKIDQLNKQMNENVRIARLQFEGQTLLQSIYDKNAPLEARVAALQDAAAAAEELARASEEAAFLADKDFRPTSIQSAMQAAPDTSGLQQALDATLDKVQALAKGYSKLLFAVDPVAEALDTFQTSMRTALAASREFSITNGKSGLSAEEFAKVVKGLNRDLNALTDAEKDLIERNRDIKDTFQSLFGSLSPAIGALQKYKEGLKVVAAAENLMSEATSAHTLVRKLLKEEMEDSIFKEHREMLIDTRDAYDDLNGSLFPTIAAQQAMTEGTAILDEALKLQIITIGEYNTSMDQLKENFGLAFGEAQLESLEGFAGGINAIQVGLSRWTEEFGNVNAAIADITTNSLTMMSDAFSEFFITGKLDLQSFAQAWLRMIIQMITKLLIVLAIETAIAAISMGGGGGGGIASSFTGFAGSAVGGSTSTGFSPQRAAGGPVIAGTPVLVGERGPEVFVPPTSGSIRSNTSMAMQQAPAPQITIVNVDDPDSVIDAMGTHEGEQQILNIISRNPDVLRSLV